MKPEKNLEQIIFKCGQPAEILSHASYLCYDCYYKELAETKELTDKEDKLHQ